jgi:arylsulfatase A-like enzyme/HEAT repeat protein
MRTWWTVIERRNQVKRRLLGGIVLGVLTAAYLGLIELVGLGWGRGGFPPGALHTKIFYALAVYGVLLLLGVGVGVLAGGIAQLVAMTTDLLTEKRVQKPKWAGRIYSILLTLPVAYVCANAYEGRRASQLPLKDWMALGTGIVLLGLGFLAIRLLIFVKNRIVSQRLAAVWAWLGVSFLGLCAIVGYGLDRFVLSGLYPFFHNILMACTVTAALLFFYGADLQLKRRSRIHWGRIAEPRNVAVMVIVCGVWGVLGMFYVGRSHVRRAQVFKRTVLASKTLKGAHTLGLLPAPKAITATEPAPLAAPTAPGLRLPGRPLFLISVDALRADYVGLYGSRAGVTPNIDRIFKNGVRFERVYTPMPQTSYAVTGLITGRYFTADLRQGRFRRYKTLPEALRRFGYKTAAFYPPAVFFIDRKHFEAYEKTRLGFGYYVVQYHKTQVDDDAAVRTQRVIHYLKQRAGSKRQTRVVVVDRGGNGGHGVDGGKNGDGDERSTGGKRNAVNDKEAAKKADGKATGAAVAGMGPVSADAERLFVWVHFFDPHHPYDARAGFDYGDCAEARYKSEIAYADKQVGRLWKVVQKYFPDALIVLTADHGEAFGEHATSAHGTALYEEQIRVPLLLAGKGVPHKVIRGPAELVDVAPTLLSLLDVPIPASMQGDDLTPYLAAASQESMPPAFSELVLPDRHLQAVAHTKYKLIRDRKRETLELYDLEADPHEAHPLDIDENSTHRKKVSLLLGHLKAWRRRLRDGGTAPATAEPGAKTRAQILRALRSPDLESRRQAARSIMHQPPTYLRTTLLKKMNADSDPEVRHRCAIAAALLGARQAFGPVEHLLARPDLPFEMRYRAAMALAAAKRPRAVPALMDVLAQVSEAKTRRVVLRALGRTQDKRARPVLVHALDTPGVALQAAKALAELGDRKAVGALARRLRRPGTQAVLRQAIVRTLERLGGKRALSVIAAQAARETDAMVLAACLEALSRAGRLSDVSGFTVGAQPSTFATRLQFRCATNGCTPRSNAKLEITLPTKPRRNKTAKVGPAAQQPRETLATPVLEIWLLGPGESDETSVVLGAGKPFAARKRFFRGRVWRLRQTGVFGSRFRLTFKSWPQNKKIRHIVVRWVVHARSNTSPAPTPEP